MRKETRIGGDSFERAAQSASVAAGHQVSFELSHELGCGGLAAARFRLENGLKIVLVRDQRAQVFAYQTWFRVGSRDEDPQRTGLAHLFEHLMFKGTKNHPAGEFDREMERRGAETNAATWVDWTYYTESLAAHGDNLETVVHFEVDRMAGLTLDAATFRSELEVVKNERRMTVEDSVVGTLGETLFSTAYTKHPYQWPTIGKMAHLENTTLEDACAFYERFYCPNNATVVIAGDLDLVDTLALLGKAYGPIPSRSVVRPVRQEEPKQRSPRTKVLVQPVVVPQLVIGFHSPPECRREHLMLEMLGDMLVGGDSSRLYRRLVVNDEVATEVEGSPLPFADPGLFEISVTVRPGIDPHRVVALVQEELALVSQGLSARELRKARNNLELHWLEGMRDAEGLASTMGHHETNDNDFRAGFLAMEQLDTIEAADLCRVAQEVFGEQNRTVIAAVPPGQDVSECP